MSDKNSLISGKINYPRLILCEGEGDKSFFLHLISERNLPPFDIYYPHKTYTESDIGGTEGFQKMLQAISTFDGFFDLKGILIISDNDEDPKRSFLKVSGAISSAEGYKSPNNPLEVAKPDIGPPLVVVMIPWINTPGNLETLCLASAYAAYPNIGDCLEKYANCTGADKWVITKQHKMKMRCMLSSTCKKDPNTSLVWAWSRKQNLIPLNHECFDQITDFLRKFDNYVTQV